MNTEMITLGTEVMGTEGGLGESGKPRAITSTSTRPEITGYLVLRPLRGFNSKLNTLKERLSDCVQILGIRLYFVWFGIKGSLRSALAYPRNSSELALSLSYMVTSNQ